MRCQAIFGGRKVKPSRIREPTINYGVHHENSMSLLAAVKSGCHVCNILFSAIPVKERESLDEYECEDGFTEFELYHSDGQSEDTSISLFFWAEGLLGDGEVTGRGCHLGEGRGFRLYPIKG